MYVYNCTYSKFSYYKVPYLINLKSDMRRTKPVLNTGEIPDRSVRPTGYGQQHWEQEL